MPVVNSDERHLAALLEGVPLFERCHHSDLRVVARHCDVRSVPAGTTLIHAGETGSEMFIVLAGSAARGRPGTPSAKEYGIGGYFGELAILDPAPRSLDVVTTTDTTVAVLSRQALLLVLDAVPGVAPELLASLARRVREGDLRASANVD
jgi:CRP/FNR family transcriptional regulator